MLWVSLYVSSRDPSVRDALGSVESFHVVNNNVPAGVGASLLNIQILNVRDRQSLSALLNGEPAIIT